MSRVFGWDAVRLLAEPTRRRVYDVVRAARAPLTRDDVAEAADLRRGLAAFHLDQLADAGLLEVDYARPAGRGGPGAGRPAKRYAATDAEVAVSVPDRRYDLAARILATAVRDSGAEPVQDVVARVAREQGRQLGALCRPAGRLSQRRTVDCARAALTGLGYEPEPVDDGAVRLRNCPFHAVVDVAPGVVCQLNESLIAGLLEGLRGHPSVTAHMSPCPPDCCVVVTTAP